ncbi:class II fructose-bisphosphate aldolase [Pseudonocardia nigra]|uniref:class II fructose-bisphosphate aldolase n=1 Tax=Pseudonocardia nigra TaxID=1921578 RepID=UPI001C5EECA0|nr:class II fructose-bisphosphate aldolase [Pseudonocardia nigra]
MPLTSTGDIVADANRARRGVGAFNVITLEHAEAIVAGAEATRAPVVLQISQNCVRYHRALEPIALGTLAVARRAAVPVAVHLDHAESLELVEEAVALGVPSVMFDASRLPHEENVARTRKVAARCHDHGVWIEAELGEIGGKDGVHAPGARTDPDEAREFVAATGVDALAVAVGTSHAMVTKDAALDLDLIARLHRAVPVPLVLHGSSGVPDGQLRAAVAAGMTKVNIATHLSATFTSAVRDHLAEHPDLVDPRKYLAAGREAMAGAVAHFLGLLAQDAGRGG